MSLTRKDFLIKATQAFLLAVLGPVLSGCARPQPKEKKTVLRITQKNRPAEGGVKEKPAVLPDIVSVKGEKIPELVRSGIDKIGGISRFVKPGNTVLIKPNLLYGQKPEYAATTNPEVIATLVALCKEAGAAQVVTADRPTSPASEAYRISGIREACERAGGKIKILTDRHFIPKDIPQGKMLRRLSLLRDLFETDVVINVPIAKTHDLAGLTLSMKNMMGTMGGFRSAMHINFHQKIVDLNTVARSHLIVLDAYRILVRNGPTGGNLSDVEMPKTVVVGTNPVSVDAYGTTFFGMKPSDLEYLVLANQQGLGEIDLKKLRIEEISA